MIDLPRRHLLLLAPVLLAGCAALDFATRTPPRLFMLTPKSTFATDLPDLGRLPLLIETPTAASGLNSARIVLKPTPTSFEYYAGATWTEVLPVMVHGLVVESFDNTGSVDAFDRMNVAGRADWALSLHIRELQPEYADVRQPPTINVRLQARLLRLPRREEVGFASFETEWPASGTDLVAIVGAMDEAFGRVVKNLVEWTIHSIADAGPGPSR